jgi:nanoRNase/pAp phosphatase (c-di-AMP/oligoRNAs hydrolase)
MRSFDTSGGRRSDPPGDEAAMSLTLSDATRQGIRPSDHFLTTMAPFRRVVLVSHVNPDPDALASMLGLKALLEDKQPGKQVVLTVDGMIARAENRAMVSLVPIALEPVAGVAIDESTAVVMVDSQPRTGRRASEAVTPLAILDHHETGGDLEGVRYRDVRGAIGATSTIVAAYLFEQACSIPPRLATCLYYGIDSEIAGFPREAGPLDDEALVHLFPLADKDLLAQIRNPKLPQDYFATIQHALANAFLYEDVVVSWCGIVSQPDIIAEMADFFVRFDQVNWALAVGHFENMLKLSIRVGLLGARSGEVLRAVVDGHGTAGGHDKRAGGAIILTDNRPETIDAMLVEIRRRLLVQLNMADRPGRRLLDASPTIPAP